MLAAVFNLLLLLEYARAALLIEAPHYEEVFGNDVLIRYRFSKNAGFICVSLTEQGTGMKLLKDSCLAATAPANEEESNV